ncbi:polygalacturonase At1g48100-like isoform X2 [Phragmites australis]|uniref:polygalacturonase At1g48100-like isoform X2 n=1 Tax=Phragmites australis TaxID=29695 RepID=UPI002D793B4C|nr:polygalacturonase At1g48100-like isoform X2 [Phragmites australis]
MCSLVPAALLVGALLCLASSSSPAVATRSPGRTFNVLSFGAAADGVTDDSEALVAAWQVACRVPHATVLLPLGHRFLVSPVTLQGPCNTKLALQIDGTMLAPPEMGSWPKPRRPLQWLNFKWLQGFSIQGAGAVDGQSSSLQSASPATTSQRSAGHWQASGAKPTLIRFYNSFNVSVRGIRITNSPQCHLKFDSSGGIKVKNITISSPGDSRNTDGIHLQNTRDVEIRSTSIGCGDDCVSIQTGCSNIHMKNIICNPGHGISVGGLGKDNSLACVSDVVAESISVQNALYGVRIKTWQGGVGSVRNITFSNVRVSNVATPIIIDQFYCDRGGARCANRTGAVAISGVTYRRVVGTYSFQPVRLACSDARPCTGVSMVDVRLSPASAPEGPLRGGLCWNTYGEARGTMEPLGTGCLQRSNGYAMPLIQPFNYTC